MKKILILVSACWLSITTWAVVATPEPITMTQTDGSTITLKMVGDEYHHYHTLLDGTPVRLNNKGMWVKDASVVMPTESARKARRVAQQQQAASTYPLTGSPKSLVILVNFSDLKFQYGLEDFKKMLNESGYKENGAIGSCRDYFIACSDSIFTPQFDCYGPVTLSKGYAYYGGNSGGNSSAHASQMIVEACNMVANMGVDMSQYDTNNDDRLDNVFVYYAGHNEAEGGNSNTIWPHRSVVSSGERVNGKLIYDYACTSELRGSAGTGMCGVGTFCHEFGHVLGLPDYYDTDESKGYTVGTWDIMSSGNYNGNGKTPPTYTAAERFQLGWLTPMQLKDAGIYTLQPLENGKKQAYLIAATDHNLSWDSPSPSEYWILENRQAMGWDAPSTVLPGTGMLIWHIDYNATAWGSNRPNNDTPLRYDLEEAGGVRGYSASSDPFPGLLEVTTFTPMLHDGTLLEQPLTDITQSGTDITFMFKSNDFMFVPAELPVISSTYNPDTKTAFTPASKIKVVGEKLEAEADVTIAINGTGFYISKDSVKWDYSAKAKTDADGNIDIPLYVRYAPRKQVCDIQRATITIRQGTSIGTIAVRGTSPRPILIAAPEISKIEDVTPTSFLVHWTPEKDAEEYYVTLYHMEDGKESKTESFEGFDEEAVVHEAGWYSSFFRTTTKAKEEGAVSMWFRENNEYMLSPIYPQPVVDLSMWLNAPATTDGEVGLLVIKGYSDTGIDIIDTIRITKNTKKFTYSHSFDEAEGYRRFELDYTSLGGEGTCLDVFTTTFNKKTVYTYQGRERTIAAQADDVSEDYTIFYAYDLTPNTIYYVQLQCEENKGCEEHLSALSQAMPIMTKQGEPADSKHLTLAYDSIAYDPATHVIYIPQSLENGRVNIYSTEGELVKSVAISPTHNVVPLKDDEFRRGSVYIVKYLPNEKMGRKSPWIKILFK